MRASRCAASISPMTRMRSSRLALCLLTIKPAMYVANVAEDGFENNPHLDRLKALAEAEGAPVVALCARSRPRLPIRRCRQGRVSRDHGPRGARP